MAKKTEPSAFDQLLGEKTKTAVAPSSGLDFSSMLKANNKRKDTRNRITGHAMIYSAEGKSLTRAVLREISLGGLGAEIHPIDLPLKTKVIIELAGAGAILGKVRATVARVVPIEGHEKGHKLLGVQFENQTPEFRLLVEKFMKSVNSTVIK
jgi:hypothetical protein